MPPKLNNAAHVDPHAEERREKERWKDVERLAEETSDDQAEFAHAVAESVSGIQHTINDANLALDVGELNDVSRGQSQDPREAFGDDGDVVGYEQLMARVADHLENIPESELQLARAEFLAREFGFASLHGVAGSSDVERLMTLMLGTHGFQGPEPAEVQSILDKWRERSSGDLMAAFASRNDGLMVTSPTALDSHMVTMSLIRKLHPLEHGWIWDNKAAFVDCVRDLTTGEDFKDGIDLGAFYERARKLATKGSYPPAIIAEVARAALAEMAVAAREKQRLEPKPPEWKNVPVDKSFEAKGVSGVERIGDKLVFVVTDNDGGRFVIKFETRLSSERADDFAMRQLLTVTTARACLDCVPESRVLTSGEMAELKKLPDGLKGLDALKKVLARPADGGQPLLDVSLVLKMEHVDVGKSLQDMIAQAKQTAKPLPKALATRENMRQLGRMAMFDLMLGNTDRFHEPSGRAREYVNLENIDFRRDGDLFELVPLDNFSISDRLSLGLAAFQSTELPLIKDLALRTEYSQDAVAWMLGEIQVANLPTSALPLLQKSFLDGMHETLANLRSLPMAGMHRNPFLRFLVERLGAVVG